MGKQVAARFTKNITAMQADDYKQNGHESANLNQQGSADFITGFTSDQRVQCVEVSND